MKFNAQPTSVQSPLPYRHSAMKFNALAFLILGFVLGSLRLYGQESLFAASRTGLDSGAENQFYELGTVFRVSVPGKVTQLRVYALASESTAHTARLWRNSDNTV